MTITVFFLNNIIFKKRAAHSLLFNFQVSSACGFYKTVFKNKKKNNFKVFYTSISIPTNEKNNIIIFPL